MAKLITEGHDAADDVTIAGLLVRLNSRLALRSSAVKAYTAEPLGGGAYKVIQLAKPKESIVDSRFTGKKEADGKDEISGLSDSGRSIPTSLTNEQLQRIRTWSNRRTQFLKKWGKVDFLPALYSSLLVVFQTIELVMGQNYI